jgi:2-polyprenyl-6-methoxyphenol hydroxylase-like FAD-dependent oxidoreductase
MILLTTDTTSSGIAGLSAAYALAASGHRVQVFEQARGLKLQPGGSLLPPNATRILTHWGVGKELVQKAVTTTSSSILDSEYHGPRPLLPVAAAYRSRARRC